MESKIQNPKSKIRLMIVAGEASGDKHAAHLVAALKSLRPEIQFEVFGSGGDEMRTAGVETLVDVRELAIMGALEIAAALPKFLRVFRQLREAAHTRKPDAVILVDWPEFNLRLAKKLKSDGHRVFYYISPQVWAWRSYRVEQIKRDVEQMLVILPFEKEFYERHGVQVEYVGHPLLDSVRVTANREEFCQKHQLDSARPIVALLPGSRRKEVSYILPPMMEAARKLGQTNPALQFVIALAPTIVRTQIQIDSLPNLTVVENDTYNAMAAAELAVVASGTATLETAIVGTPLIICYRASELNWRLFTPFIKVPFVGMPNLIAGHEIAPELLQSNLTGKRLAQQINKMLSDLPGLQTARAELAKVRNKLGEANASRRAAEVLLNRLR
ncbi:MAG: lipid-A-disaccharide synthase [Blastocatellia bacterium]|nr:lipid-A-disaccharide synthase [Blastocatellia bacterium]